MLFRSDMFAGGSEVMTPDDQARRMGDAWEQLPQKPAHRIRYRIVLPTGEVRDYFLGAHAPALTDDDINLLHKVWLEVSSQPGASNIHHRDVVSVALAHLAEGLSGGERDQLLRKFHISEQGNGSRSAEQRPAQSEARR